MSKTTLPPVGAKINLRVEGDVPCPYADKRPADFLRGWAAFFSGEPNPGTDNLSYIVRPTDTAEVLYRKGYLSAQGYKTTREFYIWTFQGVEEEGGKRLAIITREEPRSLNDVMNGSGTGLGTVTITERVEI